MKERFTVVEDGKVVLDSETGLMWQRDASAQRVVWKDGFKYIEKLNHENFAGHNDWHYPTKDELATLILPEEDRQTGLYIDPAFDNERICWSSTEAEHHQACYADFYYGDMYLVEGNYASYSVRAVRNGSGE